MHRCKMLLSLKWKLQVMIVYILTFQCGIRIKPPLAHCPNNRCHKWSNSHQWTCLFFWCCNLTNRSPSIKPMAFCYTKITFEECMCVELSEGVNVRVHHEWSWNRVHVNMGPLKKVIPIKQFVRYFLWPPYRLNKKINYQSSEIAPDEMKQRSLPINLQLLTL